MSVGAVPALPSVVSGLNTTSPLRGSFARPGAIMTVCAPALSRRAAGPNGRPYIPLRGPCRHGGLRAVLSQRAGGPNGRPYILLRGLCHPDGLRTVLPRRAGAPNGRPYALLRGKGRHGGLRVALPRRAGGPNGRPYTLLRGRRHHDVLWVALSRRTGAPQRPPLHSLAGNLHISKQGLPLPNPHLPYLFGRRNNVNNLPQHTAPQNVGAPVRGARTPRQRKRLRINRLPLPPIAPQKPPNNAITPGRMLCDSARCNVNHQKSLILRMRSLNATGNYWRKSFLAHAFDLSCHRWLSPCRHLRRWE